MNDLVFSSATALADSIATGKLSVTEVIEAHLAQIERHNPILKAIITLNADGARQRAEAADAALRQGERWGPLHGVPFTLKDVHDTAGLRSTGGTAKLADRVPEQDSPVAARLKQAGAILLGKTNLELHADNPFERARNPWDTERTPGASSNGAAAGLATGMTPLDIGSDLAGSITVPSHFSGVYGMRPTETRVPVYMPYDPVPLWQVMLVAGPMARSVEDLRQALQVIAGPDDRTLIPPVPLAQQTEPRPLRDLRIAWVPDFGEGVAAPIQDAIANFAAELQRSGAQVKQTLPRLDLAAQCDLAERLLRTAGGAFGDEPTLLKDYFSILEERNQVVAAWEAFFEDWDVLLCPPDCTTALPLEGEHEDAALPGACVRASLLFALSGHPSIVMPLAQDPKGLPMGVQLVGKRWQDAQLLDIAQALSQYAGGYQRPPGY